MGADMDEINLSAIMWKKTKLKNWKQRWYKLVSKFANENGH